MIVPDEVAVGLREAATASVATGSAQGHVCRWSRVRVLSTGTRRLHWVLCRGCGKTADTEELRDRLRFKMTAALLAAGFPPHVAALLPWTVRKTYQMRAWMRVAAAMVLHDLR